MKTRQLPLSSMLIPFLLALLVAAPSFAMQITPDSYDMLNGGTATYHYWDDTYNGSGSTTTNYTKLSGGLGDLTDGVIATTHYFQSATPSPGPYVGWALSPTITFNFGDVYKFSSLTLFLDNVPNCGVYLPASVTVGTGATTTTYAVNSNQSVSMPTAITFSDLDLVGNSFTLTLNRLNNNGYIFLSEVEFDGTPVPEPDTLLLVGPVLLILGCYLWQRRCA